MLTQEKQEAVITLVAPSRGFLGSVPGAHDGRSPRHDHSAYTHGRPGAGCEARLCVLRPPMPIGDFWTVQLINAANVPMSVYQRQHDGLPSQAHIPPHRIATPYRHAQVR